MKNRPGGEYAHVHGVSISNNGAFAGGLRAKSPDSVSAQRSWDEAVEGRAVV